MKVWGFGFKGSLDLEFLSVLLLFQKECLFSGFRARGG